MYPTIGKCTATIKNVRRFDNRTNFEFVMDGTNTTETEQIWSNQKRFNVLQFEIESTFPEFKTLPERPPYVFNAGFGIVAARIQMNITKISRLGKHIFSLCKCVKLTTFFVCVDRLYSLLDEHSAIHYSID